MLEDTNSKSGTKNEQQMKGSNDQSVTSFKTKTKQFNKVK